MMAAMAAEPGPPSTSSNAGPPRRSAYGSLFDGSRLRLTLAAGGLALLVGIAVALLIYSPDGGRDAALASAPEAGAHRDRVPAGAGDPIDRRYLTGVHFGRASFWIQPWRSYLDTWPASRLLDSLGVNFNVKPAEARATARLLRESGFKLARVEINWSSLSYADPTRFAGEAALRTKLQALRENGLRPLILLDANSGAPAPSEQVTLQLAAPAPAGASSVQLTAASAAAAIPGRTGFDSAAFRAGAAPGAGRRKEPPLRSLTPEQRRARRERRRAERRAAKQEGLSALMREGNPALLITRVGAGGTATLSRPLPVALPAGAYRGSTLLYAPFQAPRLPGGAVNPRFAATLHGWLGYVRAVTRLAASIFGSDGYDLEVWNELSFGSQFLNSQYYESGPGAKGLGAVTKEVSKALLVESVRFVRDPVNGVGAGVGVSDGFADQTPFVSGAQAPVGLT